MYFVDLKVNKLNNYNKFVWSQIILDQPIEVGLNEITYCKVKLIHFCCI